MFDSLFRFKPDTIADSLSFLYVFAIKIKKGPISFLLFPGLPEYCSGLISYSLINQNVFCLKRRPGFL